jgi:hypothetical protein
MAPGDLTRKFMSKGFRSFRQIGLAVASSTVVAALLLAPTALVFGEATIPVLQDAYSMIADVTREAAKPFLASQPVERLEIPWRPGRAPPSHEDNPPASNFPTLR